MPKTHDATIDLPGTPRSRPFVDDFNGDGVPDILVGAADGLVRLYIGHPDDSGNIEPTIGNPGDDYVYTFRLDYPAVAVEDNFTTEEDTPLSVAAPGILANDVGLGGAQPPQAVLTSPTLYGTLELNSDGSFAYTPDNQFNREDTFEYYVDDGTHQSDPVTVTITVATAYPWYNCNNRLNVNDDTYITPIDALLVINALNRGETGKLPLDRPRPLAKPFYDVNRDGYLSPIDALQVINYLNRGGSGEGEPNTFHVRALVAIPEDSPTFTNSCAPSSVVGPKSDSRLSDLETTWREDLVPSWGNTMQSYRSQASARHARLRHLHQLLDDIELDYGSELDAILEVITADVMRTFAR